MLIVVMKHCFPPLLTKSSRKFNKPDFEILLQPGTKQCLLALSLFWSLGIHAVVWNQFYFGCIWFNRGSQPVVHEGLPGGTRVGE